MTTRRMDFQTKNIIDELKEKEAQFQQVQTEHRSSNILDVGKEQESQSQQVQEKSGLSSMKNIMDVLKEKEAQLQQVQKEVEALQLVMHLLAEDTNRVQSMQPRSSGPATVSELKLKESPSGLASPSQFP
jgi:Zn-dependent oligopeptidase